MVNAHQDLESQIRICRGPPHGAEASTRATLPVGPLRTRNRDSGELWRPGKVLRRRRVEQLSIESRFEWQALSTPVACSLHLSRCNRLSESEDYY